MATTGTAMAAGHLVNGDKLIKPHTLSGNRLRAHTVTGAQINVKRLGTVPKAKTAATARALPPLVWQKIAFTGGWQDYNGVTNGRAAAVAIDAQGIVHLRGGIYCPGDGCAAQFATVPAAFRPSEFVYLAADTSGARTGRVDLDSSGAMYAYDATGTGPYVTEFTSLDGLTYAPG